MADVADSTVVFDQGSGAMLVADVSGAFVARHGDQFGRFDDAVAGLVGTEKDRGPSPAGPPAGSPSGNPFELTGSFAGAWSSLADPGVVVRERVQVWTFVFNPLAQRTVMPREDRRRSANHASRRVPVGRST